MKLRPCVVAAPFILLSAIQSAGAQEDPLILIDPNFCSVATTDGTIFTGQPQTQEQKSADLKAKIAEKEKRIEEINKEISSLLAEAEKNAKKIADIGKLIAEIKGDSEREQARRGMLTAQRDALIRRNEEIGSEGKGLIGNLMRQITAINKELARLSSELRALESGKDDNGNFANCIIDLGDTRLNVSVTVEPVNTVAPENAEAGATTTLSVSPASF